MAHEESKIIIENLPFDLGFEIIKRLPVKKLIQVRTVCKQWNSLIYSPLFNNNYPKLDLFAMENLGTHYTYALFDDIGFLSKPLNPPEPLRSLTNIRILDKINRYVCFYGDLDSKTKRVVMWNPMWNRADAEGVECLFIDIPISNPEYTPRVGFGLCPHSRYTKLVKADVDYKSGEPKVELFTIDTNLGTYFKRSVSDTSGIWRDLECAKVCENGVIYFRAYDNIYLAPGDRTIFFVSFNLVTEKFGIVYLPERLAHTRNFIQSVKVNGSLGLLEYHDGVCSVWTKEEGADGTFTEKFTHKVVGKYLYGDILGFTNKRKPVVERSGKRAKLSVRAY